MDDSEVPQSKVRAKVSVELNRARRSFMRWIYCVCVVDPKLLTRVWRAPHWRDIEMYPIPKNRPLTLHPAVLITLSSDDEEETYEDDNIPSSDPDPPIPPLTNVQMEALSAERASRLGYPGDFRTSTPVLAQREIDGIELGARVQMRTTTLGSYIRVVDAEMILAGAMRKIRDLTYRDED
ncbi:hypothetical protein AgCh_028492 [Apium graveolens]